jgi:arginine decarboxylase
MVQNLLPTVTWSLQDSKNTYGIGKWGDSYFSLNEKGNVVAQVHPDCAIDLYALAKVFAERGYEAPLLFRFNGIIENQVRRLVSAFATAQEKYDYQAEYKFAFPIKVNQQKQILDVLEAQNDVSLEVGSKAELLVALTRQGFSKGLILCNGFKDHECIELALLAKKMGKRVIITVEQPYEIDLILKKAKSLQVEADIGLRMKPHTQATGRWSLSAGDGSKFGLSTHEILSLAKKLKALGKLHWVKLLHFHIGSQIAAISSFEKVLSEVLHMYGRLSKIYPSLSYLDVGGGLGVDYEGRAKDSLFSVDYTLEEYAEAIVASAATICDKMGVAHPILITESGRFTLAHSSVLVTQVVDVNVPKETYNASPPTPLHAFEDSDLDALVNLYPTSENYRDVLCEAKYFFDKIRTSFSEGTLSLEELASAEAYYYQLLYKINDITQELEGVPLYPLYDTYVCNFTIFRSLPDAWGIAQSFPVMPLHRLTEEPTRKGILVDLTCDSDGKLDQFTVNGERKPYTLLHEKSSAPYYIGAFLVGAYQEILGNYHNLFGNTHVIHIDVDAEGSWEYTHTGRGHSIQEMVSLVHYDPKDLLNQFYSQLDQAEKDHFINNREVGRFRKKFRKVLNSSTYLKVSDG